MGIGLPADVAELWQAYDPDSYEELFTEADDEGVWFVELPEWALNKTEGPFYIDDDGAIYSATATISQNGALIGNLI